MRIIKTKDGFMVQQESGDYVENASGCNLFDTYAEAFALLQSMGV